MKPYLYLICILLGWEASHVLYAQTTTQNYIVVTAPYQEVSNPSALVDDNSALANSNTTIGYFDGLGRPIQTVQKTITPTGLDLVSGIMYDSFGRDSLKWLPGAAASGNNGAYVSNFTSKAINTNGGDTKPYATNEYEASPLNRTTGQYGPGADWYNNSKKKKVEYTTNGSDVKLYAVSGTKLICSGTYPVASLYGQKTTDEDGKWVEEFTDKQGRKVLSHTVNNNENYDTYYVYDDLDNLRYVIPPMASEQMGTNTTGFDELTGSWLDLYGYIYHYDRRNRCIEKKLPGADYIYMTYDLADRLVASQDGNQRIKGQWTVNKYDVFGRLLYSGLVTDTRTGSQMASDCATQLFTESFSSSGTIAGYSNTVAFTYIALLTVNYYDKYDFLPLYNPGNILTNATPPAGYTPPDATPSNPAYAKTLLTGTRVYHLDNPLLFEATALYYDKYGRVVQTRATNHLGGYDVAYNALDFTGKPTATKKVHGKTLTTTDITEVYGYTYDKAQRLLTMTHSLNGATPVTLATNSYDALGRLTSKARQNGAEAVNYSYNIRSWVTIIQKGGGWKEQLFYQDDPTNPLYNGNIARSTWTYPIRRTETRGYIYTYDALNRLTQANYYGLYNGIIHGQHVRDEYFSYDKMGNVMSIQRKNKGSLIDDLTFYYTGNQLLKVDDNVKNSYPSYYLTEYTNYSTGINKDFIYDTNGNLTADLDKDIVTIRYNVLNLPDVIQFRNGNQVINSYDATGKKLRTRYYTTMITVNVPVGTIHGDYSTSEASLRLDDYFGNILYENGTSESNHPLTKVLTPEGYIDYSNGNRYCYYLKDHLGSIREVTSYQGNIGTKIQDTQYYPSGTPFEQSHGIGEQPYKFTGKEFITMHGLNWQDYGARWLDNVRMQWTTLDPLCEKYYAISPYTYCADDPIRLIDPNGKEIWIAYVVVKDGKKAIETYQYKNNRLYDSNGKEYKGKNSYLNTVKNQLNQLKKDNWEVGDMISKLETNEYKNTITNISDKVKDDARKNENATVPYNSWGTLFKIGYNTEIQYDPYSTKGTKPEEIPKHGTRNSRVGLVHELSHAEDENAGGYMNSLVKLNNGQEETRGEKKARHIENLIRDVTKDPKVAE